MDDYAPFPETELRSLAGWHSQCARLWKPGSTMCLEHEARAKVCRDALEGHIALRDRFLNETAEHRATLGRLQVTA